MSSVFLILAACSFYGSVWSSGCPQKQVIPAFLDTAADFIARAKHTLSDCDAWDEYINLDDIPIDCADHYNSGRRTSGHYIIRPNSSVLNGQAFKVYCDMDTNGGGWTVIQRRGNFGNPIEYFFRDWISYREGFGLTDQEFWLGNKFIHALTKQKIYEARFDLMNVDGEWRNESVGLFSMDGEEKNFALHVAEVSGTAGDSISYHNGMQFSTKDRDNDKAPNEHCAIKYQGAWWYNACLQSNLNGINYQGSHPNADDGIDWITFTGHYNSLKNTEIKIRPKQQPDPDISEK